MFFIDLIPLSSNLLTTVTFYSADSRKNGILGEEMKTRVLVNDNGHCSWYCPLILESECSVDVEVFPFDNQSCPLRFGLWTYSEATVNLSFSEGPYGDLDNYTPNSEWRLQSMTASRQVLEATHSRYPVLDYEVCIIRRSKFYYTNLIWPGLLIAALSMLNFLLPPESGERVSLGITTILGVLFFLMIISENTPHSSDSVPLASQFFSFIMALSTLGLIASCMSIKFLHMGGDELKNVPYVVRIVINVYLAKLLLFEFNLWSTASIKKEINNNHGECQDPLWPQNMLELGHLKALPSPNKIRLRKRTRDSFHAHSPLFDREAVSYVKDALHVITSHIKEDQRVSRCKDEWRKAVKVLDRLWMVLFVITTIISCVYLLNKAPKVFIE